MTKKDHGMRTVRTSIGTMFVGKEERFTSVGVTLHVLKQIGFQQSQIEGATPRAVVVPLDYRAFFPWSNVIDMQYDDVTIQIGPIEDGEADGES